MKFNVIVDAQVIPKDKKQQAAFAKGAYACHEGKPRTSNPYKNFQGGFLSCWDQAWALVDAGHVTVELDVKELFSRNAQRATKNNSN